MKELIVAKAREMLQSGAVTVVLAWQAGDLPYDTAPALFKTIDSLKNMAHNSFCGSNLSKYLIENNKSDGKILIFAKPCDTYSINQLIGEHRVDRDKLYIVGIGCRGMVDIDKIRENGFKGISKISDDGETITLQTMYGDGTCPRADVLLNKCKACKGKEHMVFDEILGREISFYTTEGDKFAKVTELEEMNSNDRFAFWRGELSKCIRCNACRNACPACTCLKCIFDNPHSGVSAKVNATEHEENMFHVIRAFHVAGRCSDCGECARVCPQGIPIDLLNRKFIKDINSFYGEFQAGETAELCSPLLRFDQGDAEPNAVSKREGSN